MKSPTASKYLQEYLGNNTGSVAPAPKQAGAPKQVANTIPAGIIPASTLPITETIHRNGQPYIHKLQHPNGGSLYLYASRLATAQLREFTAHNGVSILADEATFKNRKK